MQIQHSWSRFYASSILDMVVISMGLQISLYSGTKIVQIVILLIDLFLTGNFFLHAAQSATKKTFLDSAIIKCGGNEEKGNLLYAAYGSNGQVCSFRSYMRADQCFRNQTWGWTGGVYGSVQSDPTMQFNSLNHDVSTSQRF